MKIHKINLKIKDVKYPILIGNNAINLLKQQLKSICPKTEKVAIILDKNVPNKHKKKIKRLLKDYNVYTKEYLPTEKLKSFAHANLLTETLIEKKFNRNDTIIAVGGGIIGDFAGFVASILKRGINFINVPSTLLSQVDSSVGGKTAINSNKGKNLIGSFYQPRLVITELSFLKSLPKRELVCGFAEILKYSLIRDKSFFRWIQKNSKIILEGKDNAVLKHAIVKSCKNKIYFVSIDEKESGKRMLLNFGHTFAHAIEAASNFSKKINHGEAVLIGMLLATKLSVRKKLCTNSTLREIEKIYKVNNLPSNLIRYFKKKDFNRIVEYMINDKKNNDSRINLILLKKIGKTTMPGKFKISLGKMKSIIKKIN
tara:strand:- start:414 stop:1523 length:1110 start_codon:yes stop_codon:yes gene_type:complete